MSFVLNCNVKVSLSYEETRPLTRNLVGTVLLLVHHPTRHSSLPPIVVRYELIEECVCIASSQKLSLSMRVEEENNFGIH